MKIMLRKHQTSNSFSFTIDSLPIRSGSYLINSENDYISKIDFKKARVDYYNNLLLWYKKISYMQARDTAYFNDHYIVKEIRTLKKEFGITEEDNESKTELPGYYEYGLSINGVIVDEQDDNAIHPYIIISGHYIGSKEGLNLRTGEFNLNLTNDFLNKNKITLYVVAIGYTTKKIILYRNQLPLGFNGKPFIIRLEQSKVSDGWGDSHFRY
jgi:hypothetical protein